ncbi:hypothetical protein D3C87_941650 [compost metagenome]
MRSNYDIFWDPSKDSMDHRISDLNFNTEQRIPLHSNNTSNIGNGRVQGSRRSFLDDAEELPEPPKLYYLNRKQLDKISELGIIPKDAREFLSSLKTLFNVPVAFDGDRDFPLIVLYYPKDAQIPKIVMNMSEQSTIINQFNVVQISYNNLLTFAEGRGIVKDIMPR